MSYARNDSQVGVPVMIYLIVLQICIQIHYNEYQVHRVSGSSTRQENYNHSWIQAVNQSDTHVQKSILICI